MFIICKETAFQIWTLKFLTFALHLIIILMVLRLELKTSRKNVNKFVSKEVKNEDFRKENPSAWKLLQNNGGISKIYPNTS